MSIKLAFSFDTVADAAAFLSRISENPARGAPESLQPVAQTPTTPVKLAPTAPKKKRGRPPNTAAAVTSDPASPSTAPLLDNVEVTVDDVRAALSRVNEAKGMPVACTVLAQFGAARVSEVKPGDYAKFVIACDEQTKLQ